MKLITEKLKEGNRRYMATSSVSVRLDTARNGQHPYAIVICCSDSRVIPEQIFDAGLGELSSSAWRETSSTTTNSAASSMPQLIWAASLY